MPNTRLARGHHLPHDITGHRELCLALLGLNPDDTIVVGRSAAVLHRMWLPGEPAIPEFATTEPGRSARQMRRCRRPEFRSRRRSIPLSHRMILDGVPITTLSRTWCDLAALLSKPDLVAAGDRALQLGTTVDRLDQMIGQLAGHRGSAIARGCLPYLDGRSQSRPESHLRVALAAAGLDFFAVNEAVRDEHGGWLAEPDLSCAEAKVALEYQGAGHADLKRMRRDLTRDTDLRRSGWVTLYYGPAEVFGRPWLIAPEVQDLIRRRAPHLLTTRPANSRSRTTSG